MSLNFAAISPHPPIIVSDIGGQEDIKKTADTIIGMRKLTTAFNEADIDTLIIISPHFSSALVTDRFQIGNSEKLFGSFAQFGHPDIMVEQKNNLDFVETLSKNLEKDEVPFELFDRGGEFFELDHGIMVPLMFLKSNQESSFKVVPISYANLDKAAHFSFGQILKETAQNYIGRVGILASGDLSHQLFTNPDGKKFDQKLMTDLKENKFQDIVYYDDDFVENAGECGYRSILILLGALDGIDTKCDVLSYEGPFGVGYLVANFNLPET